jgi:Ca2+-binding EF-hand superfamily protein
VADTSKYQTAFDIVDSDDDGLISPIELKAMMQALGDEVTDARAEEMVRRVDGDGDGRISLDEFAAFMECGGGA